MKISKKELKRFIRESMIKPSVGDPDFDERIKELGPYGDELASSMGYGGQFSRDTVVYELGPLIKSLRKEDIESINQVMGKDIVISGDGYGFYPYEIWDKEEDKVLIGNYFYQDMLTRIVEGDPSVEYNDYAEGMTTKVSDESIKLAHESLLSVIIKVSNRAEVFINDVYHFDMGNTMGSMVPIENYPYMARPEYELNEPFKSLEDMGKLVVTKG